MLNKDDILARLQNGESVETIADEIADVLNAANGEFQEEKRKAAEAEKGKELQKLADLQDIIDLMHDFCIEYYCENDEDINTVQAAFATLDAKSVNKMIEDIGEYAIRLMKMEEYFDKMFGTPAVKKLPKKSAPAPTAETKSADDVIGSFLSSMGLK